VEVFIEQSGSNGLAIDGSGLVACTHDQQNVSRYSLETRERSVLVSDVQGKHFNSPNDVTVHSDGHIYFTDPDWQIGQRKSETGVTGVYMRDATGTVSRIDGELPKPNGITLSPDETRLYVGSLNGEINEYPVAPDGSVGVRRLFAKVDQPDGMAIDCAGNLYVASHGPGQVVVLSKEGELISTIEVGPRTTNAAFGGPDRRTLLITSGTGVYSIETKVPGLPY
jgi:gluconolactonase